MLRSRILSFRDMGHKLCDVLGADRAEWDELIFLAMRGHDLEAEIAQRSAEVASDPNARPHHAPVEK